MTGVSQGPSPSNGPTTQVQAQANGNSNGQAISSATGAAGALAGWAFASLGKVSLLLARFSCFPRVQALTPADPSSVFLLQQLASADLHSTMSEQPIPGSFGAPSPSQSPSPYTPQPPTSKPASSMRLTSNNPHKSFGGVGASRGGHSAIDDILQGEADEDSVADAWGASGGGDLIDVDADGDDWGGFEEAPVPLYPVVASTPAPQEEEEEDAWGQEEEVKPKPKPTPKPTPTKPKAAAAPKPRPAPTPKAPVVVAASTPPPPQPAATPEPPAAVVNLASLSKEEKEAEMARRREERKQRIAGMKKKA